MSKSFTPGLKVLKNTEIVKDRILPLKGDIHVKEDDVVDSDFIVASTNIPGNVHMINLTNELNIDPEQVMDCVLFKVGDIVKKDEVIAVNKGLFGLFKSEAKAPINGTINNISSVTGQLIIAEKPIPIEMDSYIPGKVEKIIENEGVSIKSKGTFIQGIIGVGGEKKGKLVVLSNSDNSQINESQINDDLKDKVVVFSSYIDYSIYKKCQSVNVKGIICGGFDYDNLSNILGYPLGVAITGTEDVLTLVITEGFGEINMAKRTFGLLLENNGKNVSINGATQIRAGVMRPEIFIQNELISENEKIVSDDDLIISIDSVVGVIRKPYFGIIGRVVELPHELMVMESQTKVRVAKLKFEDNTEKIIPRANLEVILSD